MTQRALVTGGCGFVGRHLTVALLEREYDVTVVDDLSTGIHPRRWPAGLARSIEGTPRFEFIESDLRSFVRKSDAHFDLIVHLAAVVGGRVVIESSPLLVATDLAIDADLFNWMVQPPRPSKVLYFSSSAAYPIDLQTRDEPTRLTEAEIDFGSATIGLPDMTYGWSKLTGELLARFAAEKHELDIVCYRPFSGYGEDQDLSYPFPSIMQRVARRDNPLVVWGSGEQERDFLVAELSRAYGLGGRARRTGSSTERARTAVTWRIRHAITRIEAAAPGLGKHLRSSVSTGTYCVYSPEHPRRWHL